jgi:putative tryptophan/tyrosine transport system substrate-binding protein
MQQAPDLIVAHLLCCRPGSGQRMQFGRSGRGRSRLQCGSSDGSIPEKGYEDSLVSLRRHLKEAGFVEGQNLVIEPRWANSRYDRLPALAAELVQRRCDVGAAKAATTTIPIMFAMAGDPVKLGFVGSLSRPGGNIAGVTFE